MLCYGQELATAVRFLAEKEAQTPDGALWPRAEHSVEGLMQNIDMDDVERKTWSKQLPWHALAMICAISRVLRPMRHRPAYLRLQACLKI